MATKYCLATFSFWLRVDHAHIHPEQKDQLLVQPLNGYQELWARQLSSLILGQSRQSRQTCLSRQSCQSRQGLRAVRVVRAVRAIRAVRAVRATRAVKAVRAVRAVTSVFGVIGVVILDYQSRI